jgi:4,5-dihydroxyphthalate decarboxylase
MLLKGEVDAAWGDSNTIVLDEKSPKLKPLFPDSGQDFVGTFAQQTGFLPVNHTVVIQRRIVEGNPWVPEALYEAFEKSKQEAYRLDPSAASVLGSKVPLDWQREAFGPDPYPLGLAANRQMLEMCSAQSVEDGTTPKPSEITPLIAESLRGT